MDDEAKFVREYIQEALDFPLAYLHVTHHMNNDADPLGVEFFWDEEGFGSLAKVNLRDEYLGIFNDYPSYYADRMPIVSAALRKLADEIDAIHAGVIRT